ncbi:MAG: cyclic pyranopterin monophosphate synthase MoaC, partial [Planctomycetes bacterium]|nr:cyclic pyranopterin monophosphate synthase MoaC [Planctomycetota bacterium]
MSPRPSRSSRPRLTHLDAAGAPRMVAVSAKEVTLRRARARARVRLSAAADR